MTDYFQGGSFYYNTYGKTWHGKDNVDKPITDGMLVTEALALEGLDQIQVVFGDDVTEVPTPFGVVRVPNEKKSLWLVNVPWTPDGIQTLDRKVAWYQPIQNLEYGEILNPLTKDYQISSVLHCGANGENVIFQFEMGDYYVADQESERHQSFLVIAENRTTGKKHFGTTNIRVVCQNTFNASLSGGLRSMPNSKQPGLMLDFQVRFEQHRINHIKMLNRLFVKPISTASVSGVAEMLFPAPKLAGIVGRVEQAVQYGYDVNQGDATSVYINDKRKLAEDNYRRALNRQTDHLNEFFMRYERFNDEYPQAAGTRYAVWQAATEHISHTELYRSPDDVQQYNLLFGQQAKTLENVWAFINK